MKIRENVPISELTTMRLGGAARYVLEIGSIHDVEEAYEFAKSRNLAIWVMGGGANTIGHDDGFNGAIFLSRLKGIFVRQGESLIDVREFDFAAADDGLEFVAMGGEVWDDFVDFVSEKGFSGCEAMSLIPGTVGAAPVQNIGAYGQDVSQILVSVEAYDFTTQKKVVLKNSELAMAYRQTRFNSGDTGRFFIMSVTLKLSRGFLKPPFYSSLQKYIDEHQETDFSPKNIRRIVCEIRNEKLPDPEFIASAGSFFKNVRLSPPEAEQAEARSIPVWRNADGSGKVNSGWLIEQCELKGKLLHGFRVSDKAALVLINESAKSYKDLVKARQEIIKAVQEKFGFSLEQEPVEISNEKESAK